MDDGLKDMALQLAIVIAIVAACAVHATVTLAPAALRRRAATLLLRVPFLRASARLARASVAEGGCGCAGCGHRPKVAAAVAPGGAKGKVIALRRVG
ncbi:MAG: hypothetical protein U1F41_09855 [Burkholderiales bacterium]